jgi:hypothetical protein
LIDDADVFTQVGGLSGTMESEKLHVAVSFQLGRNSRISWWTPFGRSAVTFSQPLKRWLGDASDSPTMAFRETVDRSEKASQVD